MNQGQESIIETAETNVATVSDCQEKAELIEPESESALKAITSKTRLISDFIIKLSKGLEKTSSSKPSEPKPARRLSTLSNTRSEKSQSSSNTEQRAKSKSHIWQWSSNYSNRFHKNQIDVLEKPPRVNRTFVHDKSEKKSNTETKEPLSLNNTSSMNSSRSNQVSVTSSSEPSQTSSIIKNQQASKKKPPGGKLIVRPSRNPFHLLWQNDYMNEKIHRLESD